MAVPTTQRAWRAISSMGSFTSASSGCHSLRTGMLLALSMSSMSISKSSRAMTRSSTSAETLLAIAIFSFMVTESGLPIIRSSISVESWLSRLGSSAAGGASPVSSCGSSG